MRPAPLRTLLIAVCLLGGQSIAPQAVAGAGGGYPPTVHSMSGDRREHGWFSQGDWSRYNGSNERAWSDERSESGERHWSSNERADVDDGLLAQEVGYLPVSFFGDAGGVGPYAIDGGYGGGGMYVYSGGSAGAFSGARASASVSSHGGFGGHSGGFHHGGGCK